ncbi:MAG: hypothetical protein ABIP10_08610 [Ferruginibacter sp.]
MVIIYASFFEVDIYGGVYFYRSVHLLYIIQSFNLSGQTEVGSAGEQPARDHQSSSK